MRVVLGGTFDPLHKGHKALFEIAFSKSSCGKIIVGLTSDAFAQSTRTRKVTTFNDRKRDLEEYLKELIRKYPNVDLELIEIDEVYNRPIISEIQADALVVSEGRKKVAEETNRLRKRNGLNKLDLIIVPYVLAEDGLPIKATRIHNNEINVEGKLLGKVTIAVGTNNDIKANAAKNIFKKIYKEVRILKVPTISGVPDQPYGYDTIVGARNRAINAKQSIKDAHFGVGIEAGLFIDAASGKYFDVQYCVIIDRGSRETIGHGPGFYYPTQVVHELKCGKSVGEVMSELTKIKDIGRKQGAIGYLSRNIMTRVELTEQAVLMALVPRLTELY